MSYTQKLSSNDVEFEGIVLKTHPYGDSNLILKVLSPTQGKLSLIARSARQSKKKFPASFDYLDTGFFRTRLPIAGSERLGSVTEFSPIRSFADLRTDINRVITASILCEAFDSLIQENSDSACDYYEILKLGLLAISKSESVKDALKGCFLSLATLLRNEGLINEQSLIPTAKNLIYLIGIIEDQAGLSLRTKSSLVILLNDIKNAKEKE